MKRSFQHLTPRYVWDRLLVMNDQKLHPSHPWLTKQAVEFLSHSLRSDDLGAEFGSGRSTLWLARRLRHLVSIESDILWYEKISRLLDSEGLSDKVDYRECSDNRVYVAQAQHLENASLDFCLVDGAERDACALSIVPKLKPGALLVIDNINWFLPSDSVSPRSRTPAEGCETEVWAEFLSMVARWRSYWSSNGVWDTCIWIKT